MNGLAVVARFAWLWRYRRRTDRQRKANQPRLLVDVSVIIRHDARTGIQRVVRAVWSELRLRDGQGYTLAPVYATQSHGYCYAPIDFLDQPFAGDPVEPATAQAGDKFLGLDLSAHVLPKYRSQLRSWRRQGATVHLLVYDLLPLLRPQWFNRKATAHFRRWFNFLASDADQAICISKQVSRDLRDFLRERAPRTTLSISNLQLGGDIVNSRPSAGLCDEVSRLLDRLRFRPAVLMVGTIEPRKSYDTALAAFEHLWRERGGDAPDLVIVGKPGWKTLPLQRRLRSHTEHGKRLHWLDGVTDEGLGRLYESCRGLFITSLGEGFGLPVAEATLHGRPVLARDLPVFREQALPNVQYFDDDSPKALGDRLLAFMHSAPSSRLRNSNVVTWSESVDNLLTSLGIRQMVDTSTDTTLRPAI